MTNKGVRGCQYASEAYHKLIKAYGMAQSMSGRANCWDNAAMESFFKTLKVERVEQLRDATRAQARLDVVDWIEGFYIYFPAQLNVSDDRSAFGGSCIQPGAAAMGE